MFADIYVRDGYGDTIIRRKQVKHCPHKGERVELDGVYYNIVDIVHRLDYDCFNLILERSYK